MSKSSTGQGRLPQARVDAAASLNRRRFLTSGARGRRRRGDNGGAGAPARAEATTRAITPAITWDREADVVVIGAGAPGCRQRSPRANNGASVIIVEMNFDIGGRGMMSFGGLYIGGGNRCSRSSA